MSNCIIFKPRLALAQKARRGAGVGLSDAVAGALSHMEGLRERVMARIGYLTSSLDGLRDKADPELGSMREMADELSGLCEPFGCASLGKAASSLCRLLDIRAPHSVKTAALIVHLDALKLLANPELDSGVGPQSNIVSGLIDIVNSIEPEFTLRPPP